MSQSMVLPQLTSPSTRMPKVRLIVVESPGARVLRRASDAAVALPCPTPLNSRWQYFAHPPEATPSVPSTDPSTVGRGERQRAFPILPCRRPSAASVRVVVTGARG